MATYRNISGVWKPGTWWRNIGGTWRQSTVWRNIAGTWKNLSVMFMPDGGDIRDDQQYTAQGVIDCSVPATWNFSLTGSITTNTPNGTSSSRIIFTTTATAGAPGTRNGRSGSAVVTGTANGISRSFNVYLTTTGDSANPA